MTEDREHRECTEALGAYALDALPAAEAERVRRHLEGCAECQTKLDGLRVAVDALPASVDQIQPRPELKARVMAIVESEAELLRAAGEDADRPTPEAPARRLRWLSAAAARPLLALSAVAVVALVIALVLVGGGSGTRTISARLSGSLVAAGARASVQVHGTRAQLIVAGLPAPPAGQIDELWVQHGRATPQPAGTFVVRSGSVDISRPVASGDQVLVTVEPGHGTPAPTTTPLIVARV